MPRPTRATGFPRAQSASELPQEPAPRTTKSATSWPASSRRADFASRSEPRVIEFTRYVALGDSVSIDLYPALDAGEVDVAVALERDPTAGRVAPLGAASLLYRNADDRWPELAGDDLVSRLPGIEHRNLATDGATIGEVFG